MTVLRSRRRRGGAALVALVCLSVLGLAIAAMLKGVVVRRDRARSDAQRLQADWLVEAGLERAAARLDAEPGYEGERWDVPADVLGGRAAVVVIEVEPEGDGRRTVRVRADYPSDGGASARHRRSKQFFIRPGAGFSGGDS